MKASIVRGGGVGGLVTRTELGSEGLSAGDSRTLAAKVERALAASEVPAPGERFPDELLYTVAVEEGGSERKLHFSEQTLPEQVRELIAWIDSHPGRQDRVVAPGGGA